MLTGDLRNQIDRLWDSFWSGGTSNPLEVMEQITYLLFLRRLDELQPLEENKANRLGTPIENGRPLRAVGANFGMGLWGPASDGRYPTDHFALQGPYLWASSQFPGRRP